jgi:L-idonate 5-dehydrogenase
VRAVRVHGPDDVRVDEVMDPLPGPGEVLVAMEWGGICGSDVAYWRHGRSGTAVLQHPLVLGHEVAGHVVGLGSGVTGVPLGQAVTFQPARLVGDGRMPDRLAGRTNLYPQVRYFGSAAFVPHTDGGFSELRAVAVDQLRPLPPGVDTRSGALAEPLAVALHAVGRVPSLDGRTVLVNGAGPIGSLVVAAAKHVGAAHVIACDVSLSALGVAEAMGADRVVDVSRWPVPEDVEIVFEASGVAGALGPVLHATAKGGTVVQVGNLPGSAVQAVLGDLVTRELTWIGSYRFSEEVDDALAALAGGLDVRPLMTHEREIGDAAEALRIAADPAAGSSKVMLHLG